MELSKLLFLDIETVRQTKALSMLDERGRELFKKKFRHQIDEELKLYVRSEDPGAVELFRETAEEDVYKTQAALSPEFGRIVCISCAMIKGDELKIKSYYGDDENMILSDFCTNVLNVYDILCLVGHNGKGFDFPYLTIRMLANKLTIPKKLQVMNLKPWEMPFMDTQQIWQFGNGRHWASLDLVAYTLGLPSPKDQMDGSQVGGWYFGEIKDAILPPFEERIKKIAQYCEKDTAVMANCFLLIHGYNAITEGKIKYSIHS